MGNEELRTFVSEARRLRAQENWGEAAIEANTRILVLDPTNVAALNRRARCYRERMDLSAAKEDYLRALELSPGNENIEKALLEIEEKFCDEVLADEPRNPYALRCRAGILSELDRGAEAADSFGKSFGQW